MAKFFFKKTREILHYRLDQLDLSDQLLVPITDIALIHVKLIVLSMIFNVLHKEDKALLSIMALYKFLTNVLIKRLYQNMKRILLQLRKEYAAGFAKFEEFERFIDKNDNEDYY